MKNGSETNTLIKLRGISKSFDGEQILKREKQAVLVLPLV